MKHTQLDARKSAIAQAERVEWQPSHVQKISLAPQAVVNNFRKTFFDLHEQRYLNTILLASSMFLIFGNISETKSLHLSSRMVPSSSLKYSLQVQKSYEFGEYFWNSIFSISRSSDQLALKIFKHRNCTHFIKGWLHRMGGIQRGVVFYLSVLCEPLLVDFFGIRKNNWKQIILCELYKVCYRSIISQRFSRLFLSFFPFLSFLLFSFLFPTHPPGRFSVHATVCRLI